MFASFDPVALDQACIDAVLAQPKMPNSVIGSSEACQCEDHFKAAHPDTDWEAALIHSEKIGLGSREYELVKILSLIHIYGALWLKTAEILRDHFRKQGKKEADIEKLDLKDDVLRRANGFYTYFAADIAYHRNKFAVRGFDKVINIWGEMCIRDRS